MTPGCIEDKLDHYPKYDDGEPVVVGDYILEKRGTGKMNESPVHRVKEIRINSDYSAVSCSDGYTVTLSTGDCYIQRPSGKQIESFKVGNWVELLDDYNLTPCQYFTGRPERNCKACKANDEYAFDDSSPVPYKNRCYNRQIVDIIKRAKEMAVKYA